MTDDDGVTWKIAEVSATDVPGALRPTCLIADSGLACRRVWDFPADWLTAPREELLAVIERRWSPAGPNSSS